MCALCHSFAVMLHHTISRHISGADRIFRATSGELSSDIDAVLARSREKQAEENAAMDQQHEMKTDGEY